MGELIYIYDWLVERDLICPLCRSYDYEAMWSGIGERFVWTCWDCGYEDDPVFDPDWME